MQLGQPALPELAHDCSRCADLCCLAYPFDQGEEFAINKATDHPCSNLNASGGCQIHANLSKRGFPGCVAYSCAGAGQRITQDLFDGESWREDPDLLHHMTHALRVLRPIHEALLILKEALNIPMPDAERQTCLTLMHALCPEDATSIWDFEEPEVQDALAQVPTFIPQLAPYVQRAR
ncbi:hypothetical protein GFB49_00940 [Epibacterium sp. SM1979]|uniref:Uncharacterized protein n=2 Tax=Tritonibacter litoralis TaxID=2662264 RepID=A0A843Y7R2_9RHOB|nr:hypothetical protein [Tritonibacter litoralis]